MDNCNMGTYNTGSFCGGQNVDLNNIMRKDNIVILLIH